jgi:hypothetical protein
MLRGAGNCDIALRPVPAVRAPWRSTSTSSSRDQLVVALCRPREWISFPAAIDPTSCKISWPKR